jgi:MFS family permease
MTEAEHQSKRSLRGNRSPGRLLRRRPLPRGHQSEQLQVSTTISAQRRQPWRRRTSGGPRQPSLFAQESYRLFWFSRLLTQTAQGALIYALLIILVDVTDASFYNSLFVVCAIIPALAFGLPAGIAVDTLPRRPFMIVLNLVRFVFAVSLVRHDTSITGIFAASLGIWTIHQFYSPAESSLMATLIPRHRYPSAQALSNLALTLSQLMGLVILAPVLLKTVGPPTLFALCALLFMIGALILVLLPEPSGQSAKARVPRPRPASLRQSLLTGWYASRHDHVIYEVMIDDILVGIGGSALVVITPLYLKGVLNTGAENTVFVFAPAALGLVLGLRLSPRIDRFIGERRAATMGLMLFASCVAALGFVESLRRFLNDGLHFPSDQIAHAVNIPPLILVVMMISVPAGFASSVVSVSARSVLLARTNPALRGQVIATQSLLQNVGALIPTLLAGVAADLFGVERVAIAIAALLAGGAIAALTFYRPVPISSASGSSS